MQDQWEDSETALCWLQSWVGEWKSS